MEGQRLTYIEEEEELFFLFFLGCSVEKLDVVASSSPSSTLPSVCVTQLPAAESLSYTHIHTHKTHACIHRRVNIIYPLDSLSLSGHTKNTNIQSVIFRMCVCVVLVEQSRERESFVGDWRNSLVCVCVWVDINFVDFYFYSIFNSSGFSLFVGQKIFLVVCRHGRNHFFFFPGSFFQENLEPQLGVAHTLVDINK